VDPLAVEVATSTARWPPTGKCSWMAKKVVVVEVRF